MSRIKRSCIWYVLCVILLAVILPLCLTHAQDASQQETESGKELQGLSQLSKSSTKLLTEATGLTHGDAFNLSKMLAYTIFGAIGCGAFIYGKKNGAWRPMVLGIALSAYPYFISGTLVIYLIGIALTAALFFWRED